MYPQNKHYEQRHCLENCLNKHEHDDGIIQPQAAVTNHHNDLHSSCSSSPTQRSITNHHAPAPAVADKEEEDNCDSYTYPATQNQSSCSSNTSCIDCHHRDEFRGHSFPPEQAIHHHPRSSLTWNIPQYDDATSLLSEAFRTTSTHLLDHSASSTHLATTTTTTTSTAESSNTVMDYDSKDTDAWIDWMYSLLHGPLLEPPPPPRQEDADKDHHSSKTTLWSNNGEDSSTRLAPTNVAAPNMDNNNNNNEKNHDDEGVFVDHPLPSPQDTDGYSVELSFFHSITEPPDRQQQQLAWNCGESEEHQCPVPMNKNHHDSKNHHEEPLQFNTDGDRWVMELDLACTFEDPEDSKVSTVGGSTYAVAMDTLGVPHHHPHHHDTPIAVLPKATAKKPVPKKQLYRKSRPFKDSTPGNRKYVDQYTDLDVLSGRGGGTNSHVGNVEYHAAKMQLQPAYLSCTTKAGKIKIVLKLINAIRDKGGRFLEKHGDQWYEMHPDATYRKCRQVLATQQSSKNDVPPSRVTKHSSKNTRHQPENATVKKHMGNNT